MPTSSGQKERVLVNQSIQVINTGGNTPLYIVREFTKKPTDLNSDQKQIHNSNRKTLKTVVRSTRRSNALCAGSSLRSGWSIVQSTSSYAEPKPIWLVDQAVDWLSSAALIPLGDWPLHAFLLSYTSVHGRSIGRLTWPLSFTVLGSFTSLRHAVEIHNSELSSSMS